MSRTTRLYLNDILKAADKIARFVESLDAETFKTDELRSDGVLYNLMIIGEAVKSLPDEMKSEGVRWRDIARFRDRVVHHYMFPCCVPM